MLGAEVAAGTFNSAAGCSGVVHSTAPPCSPGHAAELGGAECKGLAAAPGPQPHQKSISFLVYSESYGEFTVWD